MRHSYIIRAVCKDTGAFFYIPTDNVKRTIKEFEDDVIAAGQSGVKWQGKFNTFNGYRPVNLRFEIYRLSDVEELDVGKILKRLKKSLGFA